MKMLVAALALASAAVPAGAVNLVKNGSFEDTNVGAGQKTSFPNADVADWTGGAGLTFVAAPGTADDGNYLPVYGPFPTTSPDGGNFILADGDPVYSGAFSQTIDGLTVGKSYTLSFWQAAGQQAGFTGPTTERWQVSFGDDTKLSSMFSLPEGGVGPWQKQTMTFVATSASQALTFLASGTPGGAPPISFLDGVTLMASVPEPATWGMMIVGFGFVGFASRRRVARTVAA